MKRILLALFVLAGLSSLHAATISYLVTVDTTLVNGTNGVLFFQFNAGLPVPAADPAIATVSGFTPAGILQGGTESTSGSTSGTLPGSITFDNSGFPNLYQQNVIFGTGFSFLVTIDTTVSGTAAAGSQFSLAITDGSFNPTALTSDPDGFLLLIDTNAAGAGSTTTYLTQAGGPSVVAFTPEPGTWALMSAGLLLVGVRFRRR